MQNSSELRVFWRSAPPADVVSWFDHSAYPAGGGVARVDVYYSAGDSELGIKMRDGAGGLEIKGLISRDPASRIRLGDRDLQIERWAKWTTSTALESPSPLRVSKVRRLRKFAATDSVTEIELGAGSTKEDPKNNAHRPDVGCNVEVTTITVAGATWSTLGFEAFGPLERNDLVLRRVVEHVGASELKLNIALELSYPTWLAQLAQPRTALTSAGTLPSPKRGAFPTPPEELARAKAFVPDVDKHPEENVATKRPRGGKK